MPPLSTVRAANRSFQLAYTPVAIFVGGSNGIGQGIAQVFAEHTKGNAHIILIGRNRAAAEKAISQFPPPAPSKGKYEFISCDVTLMKNVANTTRDILGRVQQINYLVLSAGMFTLNGREETAEGIDKKLALHYYSRWKFIRELLPALVRAKDAGEDAKVMSVLAAGHGGEIDLEDLGLKKSFTLQRAAQQACAYNDAMVESFALQHPTLTFIHSYPGFVRSNIFKASTSSIIRLASPLSYLLYPFTVSITDCGEHLFYGMTNSHEGSFLIDDKGDVLPKERHYRGGEQSARQKLWEHTLDATKTVTS